MMQAERKQASATDNPVLLEPESGSCMVLALNGAHEHRVQLQQ